MEPSGHADSSPNVHLPLAPSKQVAIAGTAASTYNEIPAIPRSSSYDHVPDIVALDGQCQPRIIQRTLSDNALKSLAHPTEGVSRHSPIRRNTTAKDQGLSRQSSARFYMNARVNMSNTLLTPHSQSAAYNNRTEDTSSPVGIERKPRSVSGSLTSFAKKSWATASRSPSPRKRAPEVESDALSVPALCQTMAFPPAAAISERVGENLSNAMVESVRKGPIEGKKSRRPLSAFLGRASSDSKVHLVPSIPKAFSSDTLSATNHVQQSTNTPLTIPRSISSDRLHSLGNDSPRRRDELWGAFRALDSEFHKFQARPNVSKTGIVRSALLPFLRNYAEHPSNTILKPEELDRRIQVLNRWWIGLLEMLNGRNGESVSGNDRPAILEAATAIMIRPEWDLFPLPSVARPSKALRSSLKSRSTTSLGSTASEFLADSVYHNIKNAFEQNLLTQMTYVVDKMSTRNVPASVVKFCGKAAAYAFFYCDGVAEILVRIWNISPEVLRRVVAENGIRRDADLKSASERIIARFPACLHALSFRSLQTMAKHLRIQPQMPIAIRHIPWQGPWVGRWTGRDTELFFTFAKAYFTFICRLLPEDHTSEEIISTPAHALIQAQILNLLDATMQNTVSHTPLNHLKEPQLMTFDDILGETDASATLLPLPGILRPMAENRLIILLRDSLSGAHTVTQKGREVFAATFELLLKASARRISVFDHDGCFTLCDFMEEALVIIDRHHHTSGSFNIALDWAFWLEVMRKLMESQNTMTEIRLYALLYSLWGLIVLDETRKSEVCLEWLLREDFFQAQFSHWCPMVRAYFMRLLCWRVARVEGNGSELDRRILETLSLRLERGWCYYLYLKDFSAISGLVPPSTMPCNPAPGRRLLIVRDDLQASSSGMFLNFDSILSDSSSTQATAYERHSSLHPLTQDTASATRATRNTTQSANTGKKRWGLLKNIIPFAIGPTDRPQVLSQGQNPIADKELLQDTIPRDGGKSGGKSKFDRPGKKLLTMSSRSSLLDAPIYHGHSFKFSLEWIDRDKVLMDKEKELQPPQLPIGAQVVLQSQRGRKRLSEPCEPTGAAVKPSKYVGRALAEWSAIITECQSFFERRRIEGVPLSLKVETPTLGVEPFRKFG